MSIFKRNKTGGIFDVIRCDQPSYLIWKWHPDGVELGQSKRETALRTNSVLRVKDGEVAVFVYKQKDGTMQDYIVGPFDQKIKTGNFPVLSKFVGLLYEGDTPFQAEVFFINLAEIIQVRFGVPYFSVCDSRFQDFSVPLAVRGTITFKIEDYKHFIKCNRLDNFDIAAFQNQIKDAISRYVRAVVPSVIRENNISLVNIESRSGEINTKIEDLLIDKISDSFGVKVTRVDIGALDLNKDCDEYLELKRVTKDVITARSSIDLEHYEESLRIQREEQQYATRKQTETSNLASYQIEKQTEVGLASANALGQMGQNGAGNINMNGNTTMNPMNMMTGMVLGGAVAQNIAGTINSSMNAVNNSVPPIPEEKFNVARNGQQMGVFTATKIKEMISNGQLDRNSFIWKQGMTNWEKIGDNKEFSSCFPEVPPIPKE